MHLEQINVCVWSCRLCSVSQVIYPSSRLLSHARKAPLLHYNPISSNNPGKKIHKSLKSLTLYSWSSRILYNLINRIKVICWSSVALFHFSVLTLALSLSLSFSLFVCVLLNPARLQWSNLQEHMLRRKKNLFGETVIQV